MTKQKIGIFSGSFDPVHGGHLAFALKAAQTARLDKIYFLPELKPQHKAHTTHHAHRLALLKIATKPYGKLEVLELPDRSFSVAKTLPRLKKKFKNDELWLLLGSDIAQYLSSWPHVDRLLTEMKLIIGIRQSDNPGKVQKDLKKLSAVPKGSYIIDSQLSSITSSQIREALKSNKPAQGLLVSTKKYIKKHWLYSAVSSANL